MVKKVLANASNSQNVKNILLLGPQVRVATLWWCSGLVAVGLNSQTILGGQLVCWSNYERVA